MASKRARPRFDSPKGIAAQAISEVEWVPREQLKANSFNPNKQAPPEFALLRLSLLEDGWLAPLVVRDDGVEIVDGYHRWLVSADPDVSAMTGGKVPIVRLVTSPASQRMTTIRMNRARGTHGVVKMADIVEELASKMNLATGEIGTRLGMEPEEVRRLLDRGKMLKTDGEFGPAWVPAPKGRKT